MIRARPIQRARRHPTIWFARGTTLMAADLATNCSNNYGPYQFPEKLIPFTIIKGLAASQCRFTAKALMFATGYLSTTMRGR